ncbi:MAG: glycine zipper 2TM domain-containing protein [Sphingomonadaceae bacterium]|nr:glycine zipper 2TM domain-containing protein [Sphingomonadaceae bacterium]
MLASALIVFREVFEAGLILGIVLSATRGLAGRAGWVTGGVLGGLLGREIGRGGYYNRPSTTGAIIGAGAGALAGREIERSSHC